jgi:hypothetical protein
MPFALKKQRFGGPHKGAFEARAFGKPLKGL